MELAMGAACFARGIERKSVEALGGHWRDSPVGLGLKKLSV